MFNKKGLWHGLIYVFALLLCICVTVGLILEQFSTNVDSVLGTLSTRLVSDDGEEGSSLYSLYTPDEDYLNDDGTGNSTAVIQAAIDLGEAQGAEGTVLLKNDGTLPLSRGTGVTLLGIRSHVPILGAGMGVKVQGPVITLEDALSRTTTDWSNAAKWTTGTVGSEMDTFEFTGAGFSLNPTTISFYESNNTAGYTYDGTSEDYGYSSAAPALTVVEPDVSSSLGDTSTYSTAIVVIGRPGSEAFDYIAGAVTDSGSDAATESLQLTSGEKKLISTAESNFSKVILIINSCNPMEIDDYKNDSKISAILNISYPGAYGMLGVADVLCGTTSPSGALADIDAATGISAPAMMNMGNYTYSNTRYITRTQSQHYVVEAEGIYTGYRYYETRYEDSLLRSSSKATSSTGAYKSSGGWSYADEVTYGFGYGLSYTTFTQEIQTSDVVVHDDRTDNSITIDIPVKVTNTGKVDGKSIVQIYGQAPYVEGGLDKTAIELLSFDKTDTLEPNESVTLTVTVDLQYIASYDSTANGGNGGYVMDKGDYYFAVGNGAHDALNNIILTKSSGASIVNEDVDRSGVNISSSVYKYEFTPSSGDADTTTFSTSKSGATVENQLPYADLNYYSAGAVTYLSRSDWESTYPTTFSSLKASDSLLKDLNAESGGNYYTVKTDEDTSDFVWGSEETSYTFSDMTKADWEDERWDDVLAQLTINESMYLSAFGGPVIPSADSIGLAELTMIENNGNGIVMSFSTSLDPDSPWAVATSGKNSAWNGQVFGSSPLLASSFSPDLSLQLGEFVGNESLFLGYPVIWGPGLNTHRDAYNGRNCEYYSEDPVLCGITAEYYTYGCEQYGLIDAPKHFAFNDQETNRSGISPFMTEQRAREVELRAYQIPVESSDIEREYGTSAYGLHGVMTSFSKIGGVECTCSHGLLTGILKNEWGFHGYTVTDIYDDTDLYSQCLYAGITGYDMRGSSGWSTTSALNANSYFAKGTQTDGTNLDSSAFDGDATLMQSLKDSNKNLIWAIAQSNLMNRYNSSTHSVWVMTWWRAVYIAAIVIFAVLTAAAVVLYVLCIVLRKKNTGTQNNN